MTFFYECIVWNHDSPNLSHVIHEKNPFQLLASIEANMPCFDELGVDGRTGIVMDLLKTGRAVIWSAPKTGDEPRVVLFTLILEFSRQGVA